MLIYGGLKNRQIGERKLGGGGKKRGNQKIFKYGGPDKKEEMERS